MKPSVRADGTVGPVIPERIITRPPSAELRPDQVDQDSLPPYEVLDGILTRYMENDQGIEDIVELEYTGKTVATREFFGFGLNARADSEITSDAFASSSM